MIEINGNLKEGGGQILRTAASLSVVTQKPCRITKIRAGRKSPGLKRSHLKTIRALAVLTRAETEGVKLGSQEITFTPTYLQSRDLKIKIETAGSITLILQGILPLVSVLEKPIRVTFSGGATDTFFSPSLDHFNLVFLKILEKHGVKVKIETEKRGFYPKGKAQLKTSLLVAEIKPIKIKKRGEIKTLKIISRASKDLKEKKVAERQISGVKQILGKLNLPFEEKIDYVESESTGSVINIIAELEETILGVDNLGKLGKSAEKVGEEAAASFLEEIKTKGCVDQHTTDQLLPYMALSNKKSEIKASHVTKHAETNIEIIEKFLPGNFKVEKETITWKPN